MKNTRCLGVEALNTETCKIQFRLVRVGCELNNPIIECGTGLYQAALPVAFP